MVAIRKKAKKSRVALGRLSKRKGKVGERAVANAFKDRWPHHCKQARRGLQDRDGAEAADVEGVPGLFVEVKKQFQANVREALKQVTEASKDGRLPIAVIKDDKKPAFVVLSLDNFMGVLDWVSWSKLDLEKGTAGL